MGNLVEGLSREIARVTELKGQYEDMRKLPNVIVEPQIMIMSRDIEAAQKAMGNGDVVEMIKCHANLKGWES